MKKVYALFIGGIVDIPVIQEVYSSGKKAIKAARKAKRPSPNYGDWQERTSDPELNRYQGLHWRSESLSGMGLPTEEMYIEAIEVR